LLTYNEKKEATSEKIEFKAVSAKPSAVKLGVLGAGLYANATLLPAIKNIKEIELVGIASSGGLHAQHSGKKFGFVYATSSDVEIINDTNINTVAILTRHDTHADLVIRALKAGKNVFVEKPLAINSSQLSAISKQLKASNQSLLTVGFNRRFAPLAQQLFDFHKDRAEPMHVHY
jgi:predicted dehydrogenase